MSIGRVVARAALAGCAAWLLAAPAARAGETAEIEPNGSLQTATSLPAGDAGVGSISPAGDRDFWLGAAGTTGDQIFALVETAQSSTGKNALLVAYDSAGQPIQDDDDDGPGSAPALAGEVVPVDGAVGYQVFELDDNDTITPYRLFSLIADPAGSVAEVEPNDSAAQANAVTPDSLATGAVAPAEVDVFAVPLAAGDALAVVLDRDPDQNSMYVASTIAILAADGTTVLASADPISGDAQAAGPIEAGGDETLFVRVGNAGGGTDDDYRVAFVVTAPEAGTLGSALAALGGLSAVQRRRKAAAIAAC